MQVVFSSSPVESKVGQCFVALPMSNVLPVFKVECGTLADVQRERDDYIARVKATGDPSVVCFWQGGKAYGRKVNGFDKLALGQHFVNCEQFEKEVA